MHGARLDDRYHLESVLGSGGMGQVWRAFDERVARPVAVKLLTGADPASDGTERFAAEARAAGNLSSPHIVTIHDFGRAGPEHGGAPFLVMELLNGQSLEEIVRQGALPPVPDVLDWTLQICTGLAAAHRAGIVHRDVKPANAMLLPGSTVKILDFGIAKHVYEELSLTGAGHIVGTPAYMSPEQARGDRNIGPAADLYAVGCLLHTLLTGQPPFSGQPLAVLQQHLTREPEAPSTHRAIIPAGVDDLTLRLLAKTPSHRGTDAAQVAEEIRALLAPPAPRRRAEPLPRPAPAPAPDLSSLTTRSARWSPAVPHPPTVLAPPAAAPQAAASARREAPAPETTPEPAPAWPKAPRSKAVRRAAAAGGALAALQVFAFASWSATWAVVVGVAVALVLALGMKLDEPSKGVEDGTGGFFVSMGVTIVSCLLLLIVSPMPWWGVLITSWVMCPALLGAQRPLVRSLGRTLTRRGSEVQLAVSAALVNATIATGFLAGTWLPVLMTAVLGVLTWLVLSTAVSVLMPFKPPRASLDASPTG
ncbi:serine/threonine protein kinase [Kitasatospora sp. NBC_01287]|uniref:serine/threonine-protein kinase n=1 Tax=Kitasatospora sp. NBC_01287 TaxID=2903573 RepID=UPI002257F838|nr:serine/threonine-protein kinase [Kitasatospora sp. NBC_01287]MCX4748152.1 serine/threonine protein kinase [Kitasatospora sp. NBC_01287]